MSHLGPEQRARASSRAWSSAAPIAASISPAGRVEVVPTAHYMMGGVVFAADCTTPMPRLYAAGEDTGGVHGANRLGGNGVANSTVFGALAGERMAARMRRNGALAGRRSGCSWRQRPSARLCAARHAAAAISKRSAGALHDIMWDDVGILRTAREPRAWRARHSSRSQNEIAAMGVADPERRYNLTWMDRLNLENLILVSRAICAARGGAHR